MKQIAQLMGEPISLPTHEWAGCGDLQIAVQEHFSLRIPHSYEKVHDLNAENNSVFSLVYSQNTEDGFSSLTKTEKTGGSKARWNRNNSQTLQGRWSMIWRNGTLSRETLKPYERLLVQKFSTAQLSGLSCLLE